MVSGAACWFIVSFVPPSTSAMQRDGDKASFLIIEGCVGGPG